MDTDNAKKNAGIRVSVIIPTYNRADFIGAAISSVIAQTYSDWELIVADDASTDNTESIVRDFMQKEPRIRYIRQEKNVGISVNRNTAIAASSGIYVAMLDSDDVWLEKDKLEKQAAFLGKNPEYALVGTQVRTIDRTGAQVGRMHFFTTDEDIRRHILRRNQFVQSGVLFTKKSAEEAGLYDPSLVVNEDYDLWLTIGQKHKFANLPGDATGYRIHDGSIIRQKKVLAAQMHLRLIKKHRRDYPRYYSALFKGWLRLLFAHS